MQRGRSRFRGGGGQRGRGGHIGRPKGMFAENIWHCDCNPRLPAEHFRVKKEGPNKGRWFYTCQQQDPNRCGFFLWDEDAKPREAVTVLANGRTEPQQSHRDQDARVPPGKGIFSNTIVKQERDDSWTPTASPSPSIAPQIGSKRNLDTAGFGHSDDHWELDDDDDSDLLRIADSYETPQPHKMRKLGVYATPATESRSSRKLPWLEQMASPPPSIKQPHEQHLITPSKPPASVQTTITPIGNPGGGLPETPSPQARYKDALSNPADSASSLTQEVLSALSSIRIPPDKMSSIRTILSRHDLRAQGVAKGRDISRLALKAKQAAIVELQSKIARLEAEKEVDRGVIQKLRWDRQFDQPEQEDDLEL